LKSLEIHRVENDVDPVVGDSMLRSKTVAAREIDRDVTNYPREIERLVGPSDPAVTHTDCWSLRESQECSQCLERVVPVNDVRFL
jgi:hypothetical protein